MNSIHQFVLPAIDGGVITFADYLGKKILLVNTASECGFTPQYAQLQELYDHFHNKVVVVGVPSNDFGGQEPGTNSQIKEFCRVRFGVTFPLATKQIIRGSAQIPLYQWITHKEQNGVKDIFIQWNFHKVLLDEAGRVLDDFPPSISPFDEALLKKLDLML